jgi:hypothetical protein
MIDFNLGIDQIMANNGLGFEWTILLIIIFGSIIFFAKDFRIGILMLFVTTGLSFMLFYHWGLNYVPAIVLCFMSLVVMAFSFYAIGKSEGVAGGLI